MSNVTPVKKLDGISGYTVNYFHITDAYLAQKVNGFRFTGKSKSKAEVRASGAKWFRQKGTGRARQGEITNPHLRGGGKAHGPKPRHSRNRINKRVRRSAWLSALGYHLERGSLLVVDASELVNMEKTRDVAAFLDDAEMFERTVICCKQGTQLERNARNIRNVLVLSPDRLNVMDMMHAEHVLFTDDALKSVEMRARAMRGENAIRRGSLSLSTADLSEADEASGIEESNDE
ncbi:50S ribosomal protein L4 [bacterium]|nr:50S ribosomal protein L4 [bacterium]